MCGLVGIFGDDFSKNKSLFEELLHIDQLRGPHSTGVAFLNEKYVQVIKDTVIPDELFYYKKFIKAMNKNDHIGLMGHNRQATRGEVIPANAHPFMHGSITLTHNGTCSHTTPLPKTTFDTDSEAICFAINEWGIEKVWDKLEYCNPGTLVFWNAKEKTLNMITNGARPLFFSFLENKKAIVWASEDWMYKGICERNHTKLWSDSDNTNTFFLNKHTLYSFKYDKKTKTVGYTDKQISFTKRSYNSYGNSYQYGYSQVDWDKRDKSETPFRNQEIGKNQTTTTQANGAIAKFDLNKFKSSLGGSVRGIALHDFQDKYHYCVGCDESLLEEYAKCFILDDKSAFCSECIQGFIALGLNPENKLNVVN